MEEMRLQKYLAMCNIASRRASEKIITDGRVKVNGVKVTELGTKVIDGDEVSVDNISVSPEKKKYYIMLNKPIGYVTTANDDEGRKTVLELVDDISARLYPVGRLDYNTEGLLLFSNDGDFTYKVTHPKHNLNKVYQVVVKGVPNHYDMDKLKRGVVIDGRKTAPAKAIITGNEKNLTAIEITIHEGRNRQIRNMCDAIGYPVVFLRRVQMGNVILGNLPLGKWRHLNPNEVKSLMRD